MPASIIIIIVINMVRIVSIGTLSMEACVFMHGLDDIITPGSNDNPFQAFLKKKESFLFF
jgi:hypothetical protein